MSEIIKEKFRLKLAGRTLVIVDWANVYGWFSDPKSRSYLGWKVDQKRMFDHLSTYPEVFDKRLYFGVETGREWSEKLQTDFQETGFSLQSKEVKWVPVALDKSHFRKIIKELFDVLDGIKNTNSEIATKLYELREKIESRLGDEEPDVDVGDDGKPYVVGTYPAYAKEDAVLYKGAYDLIEELDAELKKLNLSIDDMQQHLSEPVMRRKCDFDVEIARDAFNLSKDFDQLVLFSGDGDYSALVEDLVSKGKKVILVFAPGHKGKEYEELSEKLKQAGTGGLFVCTVNNLKADICEENNIPADFSAGRDTDTVPDQGEEIKKFVDKLK